MKRCPDVAYLSFNLHNILFFLLIRNAKEYANRDISVPVFYGRRRLRMSTAILESL